MLKKSQYLPCLLSLFVAGGAHAAGIEVGVGIAGYENPNDVDDSKGPKITLGHRYEGDWGVELSHADIDAVVEGNEDGFTHTSLNTLYHLSDGSLQPYLLGGVGSYVGNGALNVGLGLKQRIGNFQIRPEVGFVKSLSKSNGDDTVHSTASLTLSYLFGSSSKKSAPIVAKAPEPAVDTDTDNDGVMDSADRCTATPVAVSVDTDGCPKDADNDGVADYLDKCPETTSGLKTDASGCPLKLTKDVSISLNVLFSSGSTTVSPEYFSEIAKAADFLKQYENTTVVIEGHTDTRGSAAFNKKLSQQRADAVAKTLVSEFNIAASRVKSMGYGEERPIADESTKEGLLKNRRVVANVKAIVESFEKK